jgi:hypothetical protein
MSDQFRSHLRDIDLAYTEMKDLLIALQSAVATPEEEDSAHRLMEALEALGSEITQAYKRS